MMRQVCNRSEAGATPSLTCSPGRGYSPRVLRRVALLCGFAVALPALAAAVDGTAPTPNIFAPVSTPAVLIRDIAFFVLAITAVIFVIVAGFTVYTIVRYRRRRTDGPSEPPQIYGSDRIELAWTVVPFLIVVVLFLVTARYIWGI